MIVFWGGNGGHCDGRPGGRDSASVRVGCDIVVAIAVVGYGSAKPLVQQDIQLWKLLLATKVGICSHIAITHMKQLKSCFMSVILRHVKWFCYKTEKT